MLFLRALFVSYEFATLSELTALNTYKLIAFIVVYIFYIQFYFIQNLFNSVYRYLLMCASCSLSGVL